MNIDIKLEYDASLEGSVLPQQFTQNQPQEDILIPGNQPSKKRKLNEPYTNAPVKIRTKKQPVEKFIVNKLNYNEPLPEEIFQLFEKEVKPNRILISNNFLEWRHSDFMFKLRLEEDSAQFIKNEDVIHELTDQEIATIKDYNTKRETYPFTFFHEFDLHPEQQIVIKNMFP